MLRQKGLYLRKIKKTEADAVNREIDSRRRGIEMFQLNENTRKIIERNIGMSLDELINTDASEQTSIVETKIKKPIVFSAEDTPRKTGRGNPLLAMKRYKTIDEVNKHIDAINEQ